MMKPKPNQKNTGGSKGLTPNKQKRRPGGGEPSPVKPFAIKGTNGKCGLNGAARRA